jgi:hypothetical protein
MTTSRSSIVIVFAEHVAVVVRCASLVVGAVTVTGAGRIAPM